MEKGLRIMKVSSIFKYIFIIFAVGIIAYAGYRIYNNQNKEEENNLWQSNPLLNRTAQS